MHTVPPSFDTLNELVSIDDLNLARIDKIIARAAVIQRDKLCSERPFSIGVVMLQDSLRTQIGFAEAARRLGGQAHMVQSARFPPGTSAPESISDLLRVVAGMTELLVVRAPLDLAEFRGSLPVPLINAGDATEHPTQALIDLFAIERHCGPINSLNIAICGDLTMRACRSLMKFFARRPPSRLRLIAPKTRFGDAAHLLAPVARSVEYAKPGNFADMDVLYLPGLPPERNGDAMSADARQEFALNDRRLRNLPPSAAIFSPMPLIDEICCVSRRDPRLKMFAQSDSGVPVRMAVLEMMVPTLSMPGQMTRL